MRKDSFNFENCLLNLNYIEHIEKNEIKTKIEEFEKNILKEI